ncbi:MAG TPA: type II toxin-antitoxin system PrlF family antitoxin [Candidatus Tectomicrobia bacterium]
MVVTSKVTSKHQATIPAIVRKALGIQRGDAVAFEIEDGIVTIRRATGLDKEYADAVAATLSEWLGEHDEEAYRDL